MKISRSLSLGFISPFRKERTSLLRSHDVSFLTEAYFDIKNVLVPHDVYTTVAMECANIAVRFLSEKKKWTFTYKFDSLLFCVCFLLGIPQTFNTLLIEFFSIQTNRDLRKETTLVLLGLSKWFVYNSLIRTLCFSKEETFLVSSLIATLAVSSLHYLVTEGSRSSLFFRSELAQILFFEHVKQLLDLTYPLHTELPFALFLESIESRFDVR